MKFYFNGPDATASVDGVAINMACSMPSDVAWAVWNGTQGISVPSSGILLQTTFTDPSPYQALMNSWCAAQIAANPALTLVQAQNIWTDLVNAIYAYKTTEAIPFNVAAGNFSWDCSAESQGAMQMAMLSALGSATGSSEGSLVSEINGMIAQINTNIVTNGNDIVSQVNSNVVGCVNTGVIVPLVSTNNTFTSVIAALIVSINGNIVGGINSTLIPAINTMVDAVVTNVNASLSNLISTINDWIGTTGGPSPGTLNFDLETIQASNPSGVTAMAQISASGTEPEGDPTQIPSPMFNDVGGSGTPTAPTDLNNLTAALTDITDISGTSLLGSFQWIPVGQSSAVTLSGAEFSGLISAIASRRASLVVNKASLLQSVVNASSATAVIAIDATSGWAD